MKTDDIGLTQESGQFSVFNPEGLFDRWFWPISIMVDDPAQPKRFESFCNRLTDASKPNDTPYFSFKLRRLNTHLFPSARLRACMSVEHVFEKTKSPGDRMFGHTDGIGARGICHFDSSCRAGSHIYVLIANAGLLD